MITLSLKLVITCEKRNLFLCSLFIGRAGLDEDVILMGCATVNKLTDTYLYISMYCW